MSLRPVVLCVKGENRDEKFELRSWINFVLFADEFEASSGTLFWRKFCTEPRKSSTKSLCVSCSGVVMTIRLFQTTHAYESCQEFCCKHTTEFLATSLASIRSCTLNIFGPLKSWTSNLGCETRSSYLATAFHWIGNSSQMFYNFLTWRLSWDSSNGENHGQSKLVF